MRSGADSFDLSGKVALITGGSRGIGRTLALGFAEAGADVIVTSRKLDACVAVCKEIEAMGRRALPVACHVGHWNELDALVEAAYERFGKVDVLVNNAGKSPLFPTLMDVTERLWDSTFAVNLKGPFRLSVLIADRMRQAGGGSIVNISAYGALHPMPYIAPYAAAKLGLNNITISLAQEYGPSVRVNAILPGAFQTDSSKSWEPGTWDERAALKRIGQPRELLGAALYFASDASSFTTGALLRIDGGIV